MVLGLALFLTLGTLVILIFPPMFFSHVEGWSFREGFYFAFITLSTIGFGDLVSSQNAQYGSIRPGKESPRVPLPQAGISRDTLLEPEGMEGF